ncbi:spinster family MFS transporter [Sphingosinicella rhizophila]|uniref:MFS transporter n=1 Tax=Sphingosinicella rhizophila TaxID=3050082 RepID=A0ABU3QAX0_9SPHN|nr:MFS transporter [Sphingosinicella sp. GR2756]MDT9600551.1 MFS transporter [Sphingosinicella sp. GR2756]
MTIKSHEQDRDAAVGNPIAVLVILLAAYVLNYLDRQIVSILAVPIKAELDLSDTQLGLLGGLAFGLLYTAFGIPIAWLADRRRRSTIIALAVSTWSFFTATCGLAQNFIQLFLCRMGVGIGEAGGVAPSYSLIADYFDQSRRARAFAFFSFGIPLGSALGIFVGGWIAINVDWRMAFLAVGLIGLPIALLVKVLVKDPKRGGSDLADDFARQPSVSFRKSIATLIGMKSFWLISLGTAASAISTYGLLFWIPSYLKRSLDLGMSGVTNFYGCAILLGGVIGTWGGGWLGDRFGGRGPGAYPFIVGLAFLFAAPFYWAALSASGLIFVFASLVCAIALSFAWAGPTLTALLQIVDPSMRTTASACFMFISNLFGLTIGATSIGILSDTLAPLYGEGALRIGMLVGSTFYLVAAMLFLFCARSIRGDWRGQAHLQ